MTDGSPAELAIVGVGNELVGDDGVGPRVVAALESALGTPPEGVRLCNAGTTGFLALEAMSGCDRAIVIDAIAADAEPGTVHRYRFRDGAFDGEIPEMTMHDVSFTEALRFAREVYELPGDVSILGVEPASLETRLGLTEPVERAIPAVIDAIAAREPAIEAAVGDGPPATVTDEGVIDA